LVASAFHTDQFENQENKWSRMIEEVKYINRLFQVSLGQHPELFHDVRLGDKWSESQQDTEDK